MVNTLEVHILVKGLDQSGLMMSSVMVMRAVCQAAHIRAGDRITVVTMRMLESDAVSILIYSIINSSFC